jgi:hypothetical protein
MARENVVQLFTLVYIWPFDANKYCAPCVFDLLQSVSELADIFSGRVYY